MIMKCDRCKREVKQTISVTDNEFLHDGNYCESCVLDQYVSKEDQKLPRRRSNEVKG